MNRENMDQTKQTEPMCEGASCEPQRKRYTISIEKGCPVLSHMKLMIKAMDLLPLDAEIVEMNQADHRDGWIRFTSARLSYSEFPPLQFVVEESVKLKQQETKR